MDGRDKRGWGGLAAVIAGGILCLVALCCGFGNWQVFAELRIGLGMALFFIAPGFFLGLIIFRGRRLCSWEWIPLSIAISMGVWAFPGLVAYVLELPLMRLITLELYALALLFIAALIFRVRAIQTRAEDIDERPSLPGVVVVFAVGIAAVALSSWMGAFRGDELDWDYFNYISHVRKLLSWDKASISFFAYKDAPPDPVHSYNIWALHWALVARLFELDPVELYSRSAFITIPASLMAFYGLARRLFSESVARAGLVLYFSYHFIYGGFLFIGRTTFYPADSQWLLTFPACLYLLTFFLEDTSRKEKAGLFIGLALSGLAMSIVHVLWGLCFYIVLMLLLVCRFFSASRVYERLGLAWRSKWKAAICALVVLALFPYGLSIAKVIAMAVHGNTDGKPPLFSGTMEALFSLQLWVYLLALVVVPLLGAAYLLWRQKPLVHLSDHEAGISYRGIVRLIAGCLLISVPYILLRYEAIQATNWGQFGRNPYRAFISETLFVLNPFKWSLQNPNMTFFPLYVPAFLALPLVWRKRKDFKGAWLVMAVMIAVPLVCFHPVIAPLFAGLFSLGYLRRLLRLAALFSFLPLALMVSEGAGIVFQEDRRPYLKSLLVLIVALVLSGASILIPALPRPYNHMLQKRIEITLKTDKDSLVFADAPFRAIRSHNWFKPGDVIFSDIWTSYRLTAYLPQYVAAQAKPGTGVPDQDIRRLLTREFFHAPTSIKRMRVILDMLGANGVVINRNPQYTMPSYNLVCGHPRAAEKLLKDKEHFKLLYEEDDWLVFRYRANDLK